ncbi:hypothetical protein NC651_031781 [Populus alba x Populus x berolinensis]|nr:hypothetical protein NC651_031781 [Populus alba x Populus x berolinensis]
MVSGPEAVHTVGTQATAAKSGYPSCNVRPSLFERAPVSISHLTFQISSDHLLMDPTTNKRRALYLEGVDSSTSGPKPTMQWWWTSGMVGGTHHFHRSRP